ncbi:MAG: hypothetical protein KC449_13660 [Anaerolineales bacterium]|nr:hypothetical protein [Anaerolineales bacterium]
MTQSNSTTKNSQEHAILEEQLAAAQAQIQQLTQANKELQAQLEHAQAVDKRNRLLESSNADLLQFAYTVSHDLQEPLRMITAYLQLLTQRYSNDLDEEAKEFIGFAIDGAKRMKQLIANLLTYSRVNQDTRSFDQVDLAKVLQIVQINLDWQIRDANALITNDKLPTITADKTQMIQLLQNLVSNAIKFRKNDGIKIHVSAKKVGDDWIIGVADNGIGIDPKLADKIFTVFKRLHTIDEYPGSGIGLAICKKVVENHFGSIWVDSEVGTGSVFSFSIPDNLT